MFGIGFPEILVVLIVLLILFDAKRLPGIARSLGKAVKEFRKAMRSFSGDDDEKLVG